MTDVSPETRLWDLMRGALTARTLGVVAELGVADEDLDELAAAVAAARG